MSETPPSRRNPISRFALGLVVVGAFMLSLPWAWLSTAENLAIDLRFQLRGTASKPSPCVIVGVADSSFTLADRAPDLAAAQPIIAAMGQSWPWDRSVFAATVHILRQAGARLIVFDIVFASPNSVAGDAEFAATLAAPGAPVVLASWWQTEHSNAGEATVSQIEPYLPFAEAANNRVGFANVAPDPDGVLRQTLPFARAEDLLGDDTAPTSDSPRMPSLALAAAQQWTDRRNWPTAGLIDYRYPSGALPTVPIEDLFLTDRWDGPTIDHGNLFRDRVVWVGPLSEIRFKDVHNTPLGRMPGVATQAQIFSTLATTGPLPSLPRSAQLLLIWLMAGLGLAGTSLLRRPGFQALWTIGGVVLWGTIVVSMFWSVGQLLPWVAPSAAWLIGSSAGLGSRLVAEQRERRRIRSVLARYVSEEVAQVIADRPDEFSQALRGERREVSVLFADLRNFTSWMETAAPEDFVAQLNEYFKAVVDCVLAHGGTLQKFIGDAVLAVWGDTRTAGAAEDARRAMSAALAIRQAVDELNAKWAHEAHRTTMRIGIGLHHGVATVGNVGHPQRMEFTVLGDVVNVASRLESANRQLGTDILISDTLHQLLNQSFHVAPVGLTILKGRREPLELFAPIAPADHPTPRWLAQTEIAHRAWREGNFIEAARIYSGLAAQRSPLAGYFWNRVERSREFIAQPPAAWNGTLRLDAK